MITAIDLPDSFEARLHDDDEPVDGDLFSPLRANLGDYMLTGERWERVTDVSSVAGGTQVTTCGLLTTTVSSLRQVWVLRRTDAVRLLASGGGA